MPRSVSVDPAAALARGELIGRGVRVAGSADPTLVGRAGIVRDETLGTLVLEGPEGRAVVPKVGQSFSFNIGGTEVLLSGADIAFRPEDRIKKARVKP